MDNSFFAEAGIDREAGLGFTGSEDRYMSALKRYRDAYEKNRANIEKLYTDKDYENYMIAVHAMKSNSRMIGAAELAKLFEELEMAARNNEIAVIEEKTAAALSEYEKLYNKLDSVLAKKDESPSAEISADEAKDIASKLLDALDDFDDELSKELVIKLAGYSFNAEMKEKLKEAESYINDFMYDEAAELIKEISPTIG